MADPRPLFYVAAFVIAALALWVISVLTRKGEPWARPQATAPQHQSEDRGASEDEHASASASKKENEDEAP